MILGPILNVWPSFSMYSIQVEHIQGLVCISVGGWAVLQKTLDLEFFAFLRNVY